MKKIYILFSTIVMVLTNNAQNFTWVKGSNTAGAPGVYGTQSVSAPANNPGARHGCAKWVDAAGNLWLFGGEADLGDWFNDLWKYNIATNEWTWIRGSMGFNAPGIYGTMGVASTTNEPGAREFMSSWTDASGNFWMFGGDGIDVNSTYGRLGDLWRYNPTTNEWTWMKGFNTIAQFGIYGTQGTPAPTNVPGCRYGAGSWTDPSGNLWLYGGRGLGASGFQGYLNDLWRYNVASNQWTWVSGTNTTGQYGVYGTMGVPSSTNAPGGRYFPACWVDGTGNLFMFGGLGFASSTVNSMNDLWKFNPTNNNWSWIGGSSGTNATGVYGTQGLSSTLNIPGARTSPATWVDTYGNFWLFGGNGFATANQGQLNDLFRYNPNNNQWTWVKGSNLEDQNGTYGVMGVLTPSTMPGGREYNTWWKDQSGKLWLFAGEGFDISSNTVENLSDLWVYTVPCSPDSITVAPGKLICSGTTITLTAINGGASAVWYPTPVSTSSIAGGQTLSLNSLTAATSQTVYSYYAEANSCTVAPRAAISITVNPLPSLNASASPSIICNGQTTSLTVSGASTYTWNTAPVQTTSMAIVTPTTAVTGGTVNYSVTGKDLNGCQNSASYAIVVIPCSGIYEINSSNFPHSIYPNPGAGSFNVKIGTSFNEAEFKLLNTLGQTVYEQKLYSEQTVINTELARGVYFYQLTVNSSAKASGKLVVE